MRTIQRLFASAMTLALFLGSTRDARAQCTDWSPGFDRGGLDGSVRAIASFDDGSGPAIHVGGAFGFADGLNLGGIAKQVGTTWAPLGAGLNGQVYALTVFDDGSGPALFVGGSFTVVGVPAQFIAKWDGSSWSAVGTGPDGTVNALAIFDDGSGPALFAAGSFNNAGGGSASSIAKWNGTTWTNLGAGLEGNVNALTVFDDGSGPALYAGGNFIWSGPTQLRYVGKWNGVAWSSVGGGLLGSGSDLGAKTLAVFDEGSGAKLYVGGVFTTAGGVPANRIAKWNGASWSALSSGLNGTAFALSVYDDGSGASLHVGGAFTMAGAVSVAFLARWNGSTWSAFPSGFNNTVRTLFAYDHGSGPMLAAGGDFQNATAVPPTPADSYTPYFSSWNGVAWSTFPSYGSGLDGTVLDWVVHDDGSGLSLFAGGGFTQAGGSRCRGIARWDGSHWFPLPAEVNGFVSALAVYDDGFGPALYASGSFTSAGGVPANRIAKWDGVAWSPLGTGLNVQAEDLAVYDDGSGPALYAGGDFTGAGGVANTRHIAKWNGTSWSALAGFPTSQVNVLAVHDDGSGAALYVGGIFLSISPSVSGARCIAKWNGTSWSGLAGGVNNAGAVGVYALASLDDGSGAALFVGGQFDTAGAFPANHIARWSGGAWSTLGAGLDDTPRTISGFDDGSGPALYAGGHFEQAGGADALHVARWNGIEWSSLPVGIGIPSFSSIPRSSIAFDDGSGGGTELYFGGSFTIAGGKPSNNVARWGVCRPGTAYCFGDDLDPFVTTDCPCGNFGASGHGCAHSFSMAGARLTATGTTSPNTIVFTATELPNNTLCTFLAGNNNVVTGFVFGDGVRCTNVPILRFGQQNSGQSGNPPFSAAAATPTQPGGVTRYYQCQYRNPTGGYCDPGLFNVSNGYKVTW